VWGTWKRNVEFCFTEIAARVEHILDVRLEITHRLSESRWRENPIRLVTKFLTQQSFKPFVEVYCPTGRTRSLIAFVDCKGVSGDNFIGNQVLDSQTGIGKVLTTIPPPASQIRKQSRSQRLTSEHMVAQYNAAASGSVMSSRLSFGIPARTAACLVRSLAESFHIAGTVMT
jgi:hypothetical protein